MVRNQNFAAFEGKYDESQKVPDLALQVTNDTGGREVKFVVEIGLSESYEELIADAKMWLEGTRTVSLVMVIKFEETPSYECPTRNLSDRQLAELQFPPKTEINNEPFTLDGPNGSAVYKGLVWVDRVSGYFEFWGRNSLSGLATCMSSRMVCYSLRNARYSSLPIYNILDMKDNPDSGLWLSEFIDIDPKHDEEIVFNWDHYLLNLKGDIREMAVNRCCGMLIGAEKLIRELDSNYNLSLHSEPLEQRAGNSA